MPSVLVTGANRGLGLELARQYAAAGWRVHACCRAPDQAEELAALGAQVSRHPLEVADEGQVAALARALGGAPLDLLINNAGVMPPDGTLGKTDVAAWQQTLRVNVLGPVLVTERLLDNLARGERHLVVNITSRLGSLGSVDGAYDYAYRASKAALNMVTRTMAMDLKDRGIAVVAISPGWVKTDMGGAGAPLTPAQSISGMRTVIDRLGMADSGSFLDWQGATLPW